MGTFSHVEHFRKWPLVEWILNWNNNGLFYNNFLPKIDVCYLRLCLTRTRISPFLIIRPLIGYGLVKWGFYLDRNIFHWYFHKGNYKIAFLWVIIIIRQRRTFLIRGTIVFNIDKEKKNEEWRMFQLFISVNEA